MPTRRQPPLTHRLGLVAVAWLGAGLATAAEPEMVGVLAVALEPAVAERLELSAEQVNQLQDLCDAREMKGMSRAMKLSRLPREEQVAGLADFRAASEREGLAILNESQVATLREIAAERDNPALKPWKPTTEIAESPKEDTPDPKQGEDKQPAEALAQSPQPVDRPPVTEAPVSVPGGKLAFNFEQQPWGEVIRWFADRAGLSLVVDTPPEGTLNYRDDRLYSPAEALDVLNGVLLTKGYTLVRKDRMLLLIDLEQDVIPPNVVTDVPLDRLDARGEYELVRVLIELGEVDPTAASESLMRLIGPQGTVIALPEARLVQVTETAGRIRMMLAVVEAMRRTATPEAGVELEVRSYPTGGADGEVVLKVLYAVLADTQTAQMEIDSDAGALIARATPDEHAVIRTTLDKLITDGRRVEVIPVTQVDPLVAASIVTKLFDPGSGEDKKRDPSAPIIEADRYTESLLVRGTTAQVEQIRKLVGQLDAPDATLEPGSRGTIRNLPISGVELEQALERIETLWPSLRDNPLRMTTPSGGIPSFRPGADVENELQESEQGDAVEPLDLLFEGMNRSTAAPGASPFRFANQPADGVVEPGREPIYVSPGVGSTVIASRDAEALDVLESLLATLLDSSDTGGRQYAVFYLKFADAGTAATLLNAIFGGEAGGGGSLMGDLAGAAVGGGAGGDLLGSLLGGGGGSDAVGFESVSVDLVPDVRLNAIYAHASPADLQVVNQLLRVIDQPRGPDRIEATGVTRLITVVNTDAAEIATVVRQVFADRLQGAGGSGGQPSPQEFLRAIAGGEKGADEQEPEKITISVDERSNSLVVRSSEPLFEEVRKLVEDLDRAGVERPVATRVVSLRNTSSNALRETLVSLLGEKAVVAGGGAAADGKPALKASGQAKASGGQDAAKSAEEQRRETQRQVEGMRNMQRMIERFRQRGGEGGRGGGGRGGGGRGGGRGGR